ncbi:MAG TPA: cell division protein ZapA [Polyangiales bacterium]|nr:cell division protein ZapA [Polyangiales bacterium]
MKHTVTLEIAGTKFRLIADADEQHLAELAGMVNDRVAKLGGPGRATAAQVLALVALGLADDLKSSEKKLREVDQLARTTITQLIARIDQRLVQDQPSNITESAELPELQKSDS